MRLQVADNLAPVCAHRSSAQKDTTDTMKVPASR